MDKTERTRTQRSERRQGWRRRIIQIPADRLAQALWPIMREILLSSGCHRCRAMIESGVEADMGYTARALKKVKE